MSIDIFEMTAADYDDVFQLWESTEGMGLTGADSRESIEAYLQRNPGMCFIARQDGRLVGAVLCGHDGRRGLLHHLAVAGSARRQGIGEALVKRCIQALADRRIERCHIFVYQENEAGIAFWKKLGWFERPELTLMTRNIP